MTSNFVTMVIFYLADRAGSKTERFHVERRTGLLIEGVFHVKRGDWLVKKHG